MNKTLIYVLVGVVVIIGIFLLISSKGIQFGGADVVNPMNPIFTNGLRIGSNATQTISSAGTITGNIVTNSITIGGETAITIRKCVTATWNPASIATSTFDGQAVTSVDIALSGAVMGDTCVGSLTSATTTSARVTCGITATATSTVFLENLSALALDIATGTVKACIEH